MSTNAATKRSFWQLELGRKRAADDDDDAVDHPPFTSTLPQVDLLPASVRDAIAVTHIVQWAVIALALLVMVVAGVWWLQGSAISQAESDVRAGQAENDRLRGELEALTPVKQMYEQITRLQDIVTTTLAAQPEAAVVLSALDEAADQASGGAISFSSAEVDYQGIPVPGGAMNPCPNPDPFGVEPVIGCLTFSATAGSRAQISDLLRVLEADPLFVGPYSTSSTVTELENGKDSVSFTGTAGVSLDGLATRLTPEQIEAIVSPPQPEATSTPTTDEGGEATS